MIVSSSNHVKREENLHFLLSELHSSYDVRNTEIPAIKHIALDPFDDKYCKSKSLIKVDKTKSQVKQSPKTKRKAVSSKQYSRKYSKKRKDRRRSLINKPSKKLSGGYKKTQIPYINVIVDSGATRHCCNNLDIMNNIRNTNVNIMVGNGNIIQATKMGDIGCIKDILYLPEIKHFLFSISYMLHSMETNKCRVEFFDGGFEFKKGNKIMARGVLATSNLYIMRVKIPEKFQKYVETNSATSLFIDLEKSGVTASQLEDLKGNMPISFEYI